MVVGTHEVLIRDLSATTAACDSLQPFLEPFLGLFDNFSFLTLMGLDDGNVGNRGNVLAQELISSSSEDNLLQVDDTCVMVFSSCTCGEICMYTYVVQCNA